MTSFLTCENLNISRHQLKLWTTRKRLQKPWKSKLKSMIFCTFCQKGPKIPWEFMHFLEVNPGFRKSWKYQAKIGVLGGPKPQKAPKSAPGIVIPRRLTFSESFPELFRARGCGRGDGGQVDVRRGGRLAAGSAFSPTPIWWRLGAAWDPLL